MQIFEQKWVKPEGQLLITDYARGQDKCGQEFEDYVAGRGYQLLTVVKYGKVLENAGWKQVQAIDNTTDFVNVLNRELNLLVGIKNEFIKVVIR
jgi:phosphoethanolamine N-methyltransferase